MNRKILLLILFSLYPLHCAYYDSTPDGGKTCKNHGDCPDDQRCFDGACLTDPPPCGEVVAPDCAWGLKDEEECQAAGGWIACSHIGYDTCWCDCPTGQGGCPCWKSSHCRGECISEDEILSSDECEALKMGVCTGRTTNLGCWCRIWNMSGGFQSVCTD